MTHDDTATRTAPNSYSTTDALGAHEAGEAGCPPTPEARYAGEPQVIDALVLVRRADTEVMLACATAFLTSADEAVDRMRDAMADSFVFDPTEPSPDTADTTASTPAASTLAA